VADCENVIAETWLFPFKWWCLEVNTPACLYQQGVTVSEVSYQLIVYEDCALLGYYAVSSGNFLLPYGRLQGESLSKKLPTNQCAGSITLMTLLSSGCTEQRKRGFLTFWMSFTGIYNSWRWRWRGMGTYPFLTSTGDQMTPWTIRSAENQPTYLYLNHPSNLQALLSTLVHRARAPYDKESLHDELEYPKTMSKENGYNITQIWHVLNSSVRTSKSKQKPTSVTVLPYVQMTYSQLNRMFAKHNRRCVGLPPRKISSLSLVKEDLGPRTLRIYSIPCKCGQVYIRRTGWSIQQNKRTPPARTYSVDIQTNRWWQKY